LILLFYAEKLGRRTTLSDNLNRLHDFPKPIQIINDQPKISQS